MRFLIVGLLLLAGGAIYGVTPVHSPLQRIDQNLPAQVDVFLEDEDPSKNYTVSLFYRTKGESNFIENAVPEIQPGAHHLEFLPLVGIQNTLEYFIRVYEEGQTVQTLPQDNPDRMPYSIPINKPENANPVSIKMLSPEMGSVIQDTKPIIVFGITDAQETVVLDDIIFKLNGVPISADIVKTRTFLTYLPKKPLEDGSYTLSITLPTKIGIPIVQEWTFTIKHTAIKESSWKLSGNFLWDNRIYNTDKASSLVNRFPFESRLGVTTMIASPKWNTQVYTLYDNRDTPYSQPLHRFQVTVQDTDKSHTFVVGDATPKLTNLTINGKLVRGLDAEMDVLKSFGIQRTLYLRIIGGDTRRAVGVSTPNNVLSGTFKQTVAGIQGTLRAGRARHQLSYVHFKDDFSSLSAANNGGATPQENHVFSLQNQFRLFDVTQVNWENAGSVFYGNSQSAEVPIEELDTPLSDALLKSITNLFPPRSSFLFGAASHLNVQTPLFIKGLSVISDVKVTQPGFTTLGNSGIPRDNFEYGGVFNYRLLDNKLQLRYGLKAQNNNVLRKDVNTLYTDTTLAQVNYRFGNLGSLSLGYNQSARINKNPDGNPVTGNSLIKNDLDSWTFNYNALPIHFWKIQGMLSSSLSLIGFKDASNSENDFTSTTYGATLSTGSEGNRWIFGFNESDKREKSSLPNVTIFTNYSVQYSRALLSNKANVFVGTRVTNGRNTGLNPDRVLNTQRLSLSTGGSLAYTPFSYLENGKFTISAEYNVQTDKISPESNEKNFSEVLINFQYSAQF